MIMNICLKEKDFVELKMYLNLENNENISWKKMKKGYLYNR